MEKDIAMRKIYTTLVALFITLSTLSAQGVNFGGITLDNDILHWGDLYNLSFTTHSYGTARSMAMGNAFTALGADMVSASMNPAGIGMYVDSDVSITPMMQFTKSPTEGGVPYYDKSTPKRDREFSDHTERFGMASAGAVFTVYRSTKALTNLNVGFVYNRIADFNQNTLNASYGNPATSSMANVYCTLADVDGIMPNKEGRLPFGNDPYHWGATAAYKNGLINYDQATGDWVVDRISPDAVINQSSSMETRGSIGEYALTVGFNFIDRIYVGASLGIQDVRYRRNVFYGESYNYPQGYPSGADYPYQLEYMNSMQRTNLTGSGFNFKLGVTARPVDWLRIGVAYHTPTYYSLALRYDVDMWSATYSAGNNPEDYDIGKDGYMYDEAYSGIWEDSGSYSWRFRSPSRLLTGVAFTIAQRVILSADYERSWYQSTRLQSAPIDVAHNDALRDVFKGSNTVRVGVEGYVLPFLPVRVGYIWSGSTLRDEFRDMIATHPLPTKESIITAGFGLKFNSNVYLDFAYQYATTHFTPFQTFYAIDSVDPNLDIESEIFSFRTMRHKAVVTLGFRF